MTFAFFESFCRRPCRRTVARWQQWLARASFRLPTIAKKTIGDSAKAELPMGVKFPIMDLKSQT
jgi:hypothetical protein